ncbi:Sterol desaturase/sphingolipid hydroxylase, fatty acid hydroxylase superfamily [Catalinimonas alkaloidigena]|uniref:Sterol desaturase/sphingolipid hydroxylase, fatty acid hydroxylase superfamily n=1 Tax=Catalinimonas alkaloidigena TaxID=1075417 RepID=A0A1G9GTE5_9BACT|nr:sterol desaturase family protein [Catalinimonas alkaloidigena]SDL03874.1 Sterol desaturase/sphingolipid hydroxylase, fatty acid hydroxylase superfamily [Catalinimonas alkaloidigena]
MRNVWKLPFFDRVGTPVLAGIAAVAFGLETWFALRARKVARRTRLQTNALVAVPGLSAMRLVLVPTLAAAARWFPRFGLVRRWPEPLRAWVSFLLLDYVAYLWHLANHRSSLLWRFHNVHHSDVDMDVSTAWRFHFGEMLLGSLFRGAGVVLIGPTPRMVVLYELALEASTAFHHSNTRLPYVLERFLTWLIVTPRMHGIHHSVVQRETNSNYSSLLTVWDRLHQTLRLNVPQDALVIGVPSYQDPSEQTPAYLLRLPFAPQRPWQWPDGSVPDRTQSSPAPPHVLLP